MVKIVFMNLTLNFSGKRWQKMIKQLYRDLIQGVV
jgi:hypothetical protein